MQNSMREYDRISTYWHVDSLARFATSCILSKSIVYILLLRYQLYVSILKYVNVRKCVPYHNKKKGKLCRENKTTNRRLSQLNLF